MGAVPFAKGTLQCTVAAAQDGRLERPCDHRRHAISAANPAAEAHGKCEYQRRSRDSASVTRRRERALQRESAKRPAVNAANSRLVFPSNGSGLRVNGVKVSHDEIGTSNGVIHAIDTVMMRGCR